MRVVVAPDSFGGTLSAREAAAAIAEGWRRARPGDDLVLLPLSDGGEGLLEAAQAAGGALREAEVADPLGRPRTARWLLGADGTAVVACDEACGLRLLAPPERDPLRTTTYGVGQLLEAARRAGVRRVAVGLGGSSTVDGGAGAAVALGLRARREDGSGLKVGGGELHTVASVAPAWLDPAWDDVEVELWSDVRTVLADAAATFGPQKGADAAGVARLEEGLARWADVVERDLGGRWRDVPGSGAAGGLGFGLAAVLGADVVDGAAAVAELVGLPEAVREADVVVTGEGALDGTSLAGKVPGHVLDLAGDAGVAAVAVVGQGELDAFADLEEAAPGGAGDDPAAEVADAAARLAGRV